MKGIHFKDKDGKTLELAWNADPLNYPPSEHFPEGWTWEEVTEAEGAKLKPRDAIPRKLTDSPEQIVRELGKKHDILIDTLEEMNALPKGTLRNLLDAKMKVKQ